MGFQEPQPTREAPATAFEHRASNDAGVRAPVLCSSLPASQRCTPTAQATRCAHSQGRNVVRPFWSCHVGGNVVELYMLSEFVPTSTIKVHSSLSIAAIGKALRASSGSRPGVDGGSALKMRSRKQENTAREKYYVNRNKLLTERGEVQPASGQNRPHMPA